MILKSIKAYCKTHKIKVLIVSVFCLPVFCFILYVLAYCFLLPRIKDPTNKYCAYSLTGPIEYLRLKCTWFWRLTEYGYELGGDTEPPAYRKNDDNDRILRIIIINPQTGYILEDRSDNIAKFYDLDGLLLGQGEFIHWNEYEGIFYEGFDNSISIYKNGVLKFRFWRNKDNKIIARCSYKNGKPYNGTIYRIGCDFELLISYVEGEKTKSRYYPLYYLEPWGQEYAVAIGNFNLSSEEDKKSADPELYKEYLDRKNKKE